MSRHDDVSCDSCMDSNFVGKRYKCLVCYDYDLCSNCFERGAVSGNHASDHPVQCILAPNDLELYYGSENARHVLSFTCPLCGQMGYSTNSLRDHVLADHAFDAAREVICPVCVASAAGPTYDQNHFTDEFALHMEHDHRSDSYNDGDQIRPRTESEGSSGELRTVLDRQMARRGTGRIASRSSRANSSRLTDSNGNNEERSLNLVRGRGIFRERESRDRTTTTNATAPSTQQQQQQISGGLRLVANIRESANDPLAELLSHMANSRAVIYDSGAGRGRARVTGNASSGLAMLAPSGGPSVAAQLEQQLQSARSLLEELQHLERLPPRTQPQPGQNRQGNVVLITNSGAGSGHAEVPGNAVLSQPQLPPANRTTSSGRQSQSSALARWCDERERALGASVWSIDDARSRALFVQEEVKYFVYESYREFRSRTSMHAPSRPGNMSSGSQCAIPERANKKTNSCQDICFRIGRWFPPVFISAIVVWSYYAYVVNLCFGFITSIPTIVLYLIFFHIFFVIFVFVYYRVIFSNPAGVPEEFYPPPDVIINYFSESDVTKRRKVIADFARSLPVLQRNVDGSIRFCEKCQCVKPDRTHHCGVIGNCVLKMDHFCPWVNNTVGFSNYKLFILFLFYAIVYCLYVALTAAPYFVVIWTTNFGDDVSTVVKFNVLFVFFVALMFAISIFALLSYHIYLTLTNQSTVESFHPPHFGHGPDRRGYRMSYAENWRQVFGYDPKLWLLPIPASTIDGITFPCRYRPPARDAEYGRNESASSVRSVPSTEHLLQGVPPVHGGNVNGGNSLLVPGNGNGPTSLTPIANHDNGYGSSGQRDFFNLGDPNSRDQQQ